MVAQPKRIVVGFDGSEGARRALAAAAQLAGYGSALTVVNVKRRDTIEPAVLGSARDQLVEQLVIATYLQRVGVPAHEIVDIAAELDADLIVVGRRGPAASNGSAPGSVSADVVRCAGCDVLVVASTG
jgi:nucleotide-binding universal stress UspA family protein